MIVDLRIGAQIGPFRPGELDVLVGTSIPYPNVETGDRADVLAVSYPAGGGSAILRLEVSKAVYDRNARATAPYQHGRVLDSKAARASRDEAVDRVDAATDEDWKISARSAVRGLAETLSEFGGDDVWATGLPKPAEPRALGPIMLWAQRENLIEPTDRFTESAQVTGHARPSRIWRSLVYRGEG